MARFASRMERPRPTQWNTSAIPPGLPSLIPEGAVTVTMSGPHRVEVEWSPHPADGPLEQIRIELKSNPMNNPRR
jgi:hypothetical protein